MLVYHVRVCICIHVCVHVYVYVFIHNNIPRSNIIFFSIINRSNNLKFVQFATAPLSRFDSRKHTLISRTHCSVSNDYKYLVFKNISALVCTPFVICPCRQISSTLQVTNLYVGPRVIIHLTEITNALINPLNASSSLYLQSYKLLILLLVTIIGRTITRTSDLRYHLAFLFPIRFRVQRTFLQLFNSIINLLYIYIRICNLLSKLRNRASIHRSNCSCYCIFENIPTADDYYVLSRVLYFKGVLIHRTIESCRNIL